MNSITHPILGTITDVHGIMLEWATETLQIDTFGYFTTINAFTQSCPPTEAQLAAMVDVLHASPDFKRVVEGLMFAAYRDWIRLSYLNENGDTRYRPLLPECDLPEIQCATDIWKVITGMNSTLIDANSDLSLSFKTTFDHEHDFAVRFRGGEVYEVMMDG
jgi:hypothetical protein